MSSEPNPGYFQFDHIIEQLPEIYHGFARSTLGLVERLCGRFNLQGSTLVDICAGTGRCALTLASEGSQAATIWASTSRAAASSTSTLSWPMAAACWEAICSRPSLASESLFTTTTFCSCAGVGLPITCEV